MPFCAHCGKPYEGSPKFCAHCGRALAAPPSQTPSSQTPSSQTAPSYPAPVPAPGYPAQPAAAPSARKRDLKWLWIGLTAFIVVVAAVLIPVLLLTGGEDGGGAPAATAPEKAVARFLSALENKDIDTVFKMIDPKMMDTLAGGMDLEAVKEMLKATLFPYAKIKFEGVKMSTQMKGENAAAVTIVDGSVTLTFPDGRTESEDVTEAAEPVTIDLIKVGGKWYLESTPFME